MANDENLSKKKLKISYVHIPSSHSFRYGTVAQSFDEIAAENPDFECYVFEGIVVYQIFFASYLYINI